MTSLYRHRKRGSTYTVLGTAYVQASTGPLQEGQEAIVYKDESGRMHVRGASEFHDGRFEDVTPARRWWPAAYMDEVLPAGEFSPADWIVGIAGNMAVLAPRDRQESREYGCLFLSAGDEIGFEWSEPRGRAQMLIYPDGTWHVEGRSPEDWTLVYAEHEPLSMEDTQDAFARNWRSQENVREGDEPAGLTVLFVKWGSARFRLAIEDRTARLIPIEPAAPAEAGGAA